MKHVINKVAAIFIISLIALAGSSASYALWYDNLHLDVDAETGYVEWIFWDFVQVFDDICPPPYYPPEIPDRLADPNVGLITQPYWSTKNVACGSATYIDDHHIQLIISMFKIQVQFL